MTDSSQGPAAFRENLAAAVEQSRVAADIAEVLADPSTSAWLRGVGFDVVDAITDLRGAEHGTVTVPDLLADYTGERADLDDEDQLRRLYRRLLTQGTKAEQAQLLNLGRLRLLWAPGLADPAIMRVWENRFPQIRG